MWMVSPALICNLRFSFCLDSQWVLSHFGRDGAPEAFRPRQWRRRTFPPPLSSHFAVMHEILKSRHPIRCLPLNHIVIHYVREPLPLCRHALLRLFPVSNLEFVLEGDCGQDWSCRFWNNEGPLLSGNKVDRPSTSKQRPIVYIYIYSSIQYDFVSTIYPFIIIYPMYVTLTKPVEAFKYFNLAGCELAVFASSHIGHSFDLSDYHDLAIVIFRVDELPVVGVVDTELTVLQADSQDVYVQLCEFNDPLVPVAAVGFLNWVQNIRNWQFTLTYTCILASW